MKFQTGKLYRTNRKGPRLFLHSKEEDAIAYVLFGIFYVTAIRVLGWTIFCLSPFWFHKTIARLRTRYDDLIMLRSFWFSSNLTSSASTKMLVKDVLDKLAEQNIVVRTLEPGTVFMVVATDSFGLGLWLHVLAGNVSGWVVVRNADNIQPVN